jgi:hypothetical protein
MNPLISPARSYPALRSGGGSIEFGITPLVPGQAHIDVVLTTSLSSTIWDTVCSVVNTDDPAPLNIWPGVVSAKSTTGFTVQLNGMPDSANYFLHWTIIPGASAPAVVATTYIFSGPSSGAPSVASTPFTVHLLSGQTVPAPVTVTPSAGGGGGTFSPATVTLTTAAPSATFTYTPASSGAKTISVTNSGGLTDPGSLTYTVTVALVQHLLNTLISYWKLDEASAGTAPVQRNDSQGTNHLSDIQTSSAAGLIGNGGNFVGADGDFLQHADNASLRVSSDFTFSVWVKLVSQPANACVFSKSISGTGTDYALLYASGGGGYYFQLGNGASQVVSGPDVANGVWAHVVCWYDSGTTKAMMRINDAVTYTAPSGGSLTQTATPFTVGGLAASAFYITAVVDEIGFWKRKLTSDEITFLYNGGAGNPFSSFLT